jgi:hypothetical protein
LLSINNALNVPTYGWLAFFILLPVNTALCSWVGPGLLLPVTPHQRPSSRYNLCQFLAICDLSRKLKIKLLQPFFFIQ